MPFLNDVTRFWDLGMFAESISEKNTAKITLKNINFHIGDKWYRKLSFASCIDEDVRITSNGLNIYTSKPGIYNDIKYIFKGTLGNVDSNPITIQVIKLNFGKCMPNKLFKVNRIIVFLNSASISFRYNIVYNNLVSRK